MQNLSHTRPPGQTTHSRPFFPVNLSAAYRLRDDIGPRHARLIAEHCGGNASRILEAGYGIVTPGFLRLIGPTVVIKKGSIVLPCRDAHGEIVALHSHEMEWFTPAKPHIANAIRGPWTEIEVCETTAEADSLALSINICAIGRNGCDDEAVAAAVLSARREWRLAA
jgi:hypothetical protein